MPQRHRHDHFRGAPRAGRRMEVAYRVVRASGESSESQQAHTKNIGVGGAFIVTDEPVPPGTRLEVTLELASQKRVDLRGEVRWVAASKIDPVHGMGVKFQGLELDQLLELHEFFASLPMTSDFDDRDQM